MVRSSSRARRPSLLPVLPLLAGLAACDSGPGPEDQRGLLQISAIDIDGSAGGLTPAGFRTSDITSFRVQIAAGPRVVVDSTFTTLGVVAHDFSLTPNTYVLLLEAFQGNDVLLFTAGGEATVLDDDTLAVTLDLDPALGTTFATIGGETAATVATNGTAPLRVEVRNSRNQPVSGVQVTLDVEPASSGAVTLAAGGVTGIDGVVTGTLNPARQEVQGALRVLVDGFPVPLAAVPSFSVVSPVDVERSSLTLFNTVFIPADGASAAQLTARIVDVNGTPQADIPVSFFSSRNSPAAGTVDVITQDRPATDGTGEVHATLASNSSSTLAGDAIITAVADGKELDDSGSVSFRSQVSAVNTRITVNPVTVRANGVDGADILAEVRGNNGQPLPNVFVELRTNQLGTFVLQPATGRTDANGIFRSRISSTTRVSTFIDVVADGIRTSAVGIVIFN